MVEVVVVLVVVVVVVVVVVEVVVVVVVVVGNRLSRETMVSALQLYDNLLLLINSILLSF